MEKKIRIIFEILFVMGFAIYYTITIIVPEYKEKYGSSDKFLLTGHIINLFEINIDNGAHFSLAYNKKEQIYHIFFFNEESIVLYNQNIENLKLRDGLNKIIFLLKKNGLSNQDINILYFEDEDVIEFEKVFQDLLSEYSIVSNCTFHKSNYEDLKSRFSIDEDDIDGIIRNLDFYSKEKIKDIKDKLSSDSLNYQEGADSIYNRLDFYVHNNNILDLKRDEVVYPIQIISSDIDDTLFPNGNSWYYVEEGNLYAYIEFSSLYRYCYQGSLENRKEGDC